MNAAPVSPASRILIVDDHPLIRDGLSRLLSTETDLKVVGSAEDARQTIDAIRQLTPDIVLVDVSLNGANGIELIKNMRAQFPDLPVLVISMHDESLYALRALRAGAQGYIMKRENSDRIVEAIRKVLKEGMYLSETLNQQLLYKLISGQENSEGSAIDRLTDRELEVLQLLGRGLSTRDIADHLHLSPKTIETHRMHLKEKLGMDTAADLARFAVNWVESGLSAPAAGTPA